MTAGTKAGDGGSWAGGRRIKVDQGFVPADKCMFHQNQAAIATGVHSVQSRQRIQR